MFLYFPDKQDQDKLYADEAKAAGIVRIRKQNLHWLVEVFDVSSADSQTVH